MNRTQHLAMLEAMRIDSKNLLKYQQIYKFAYLLCDGVFKIVFAEEKGHSLLISLLNAMLDLHDGDAIKSIVFNTYVDGQVKWSETLDANGNLVSSAE